VDSFSEDDSIISGSFPWQEATLERANNLVEFERENITIIINVKYNIMRMKHILFSVSK
jgi:hypothetical protein